jgi:hypothetical protein
MAESEMTSKECRQPPGQTQAEDGADTEGDEWEDAASDVGEEEASELGDGSDHAGDATMRRADVGDEDPPQDGKQGPAEAGCKSGNYHQQQPPLASSLAVSFPESPAQLDGAEAPGWAAGAEERARVGLGAAAGDQGVWMLLLVYCLLSPVA